LIGLASHQYVIEAKMGGADSLGAAISLELERFPHNTQHSFLD